MRPKTQNHLSTCRCLDLSLRRRTDACRTRGCPAGGCRAGIDRHREPDLPGEGHGEGILELATQPALELAAGELVGDGDDGGALVQGHRLAGAQPGALVGLELFHDIAPGGAEIGRTVLHGALLSSGPSLVAECARLVSPQLCPQAVYPSSDSWRILPEGPRGWSHDHCLRRSAAILRACWVRHTQVVIEVVRRCRGNSVRAKVTSRDRWRQGVIHRLSGLGPAAV